MSDGFETLKRQYLEMRDMYKGIDTFKLVDDAFQKANTAQFDLILRSNKMNGSNKLRHTNYNRALIELQHALNNFKKMIKNSTSPTNISRSPGSFRISINRTRAFPKSPRVRGTQSMRHTSSMKTTRKSPRIRGSVRGSYKQSHAVNPLLRGHLWQT